jgi:hypothetical protein
MLWVAKPARVPHTTEIDQSRTLRVFDEIWDKTSGLSDLRDDVAKQISNIAANLFTQLSLDAHVREHLESLASKLEHDKSYVAPVVRRAVNSIGWRNRLFMTAEVWGLHALFWIILIAAYPRSPQVQAIFFWNPWVRKIFGFGYVGFALTWVPYLRNKLLAPFKESLLADADLGQFDPTSYFAESLVVSKATGQPRLITNAIQDITGQIVLEGESGLGKSMFARHLVQRSKRIVVYLPAEKCASGVMEAIQAKLHGPAKDAEFLRNLIYSGAIDLCIDGLNEVTADTRAKVAAFVESYFKGNVLMVTQPLEWRPPSTAPIEMMQPLTPDQIEGFLVSRQGTFRDDTPIMSGNYDEACRTFLKEALSDQQPMEILEAAQRILSNPMDLTLVAQMIASGHRPDLFRLQEQQYTVMAADYKRIHRDRDFPLMGFAERVFQLRLKDQLALPAEEYLDELKVMQRHKMVLTHHSEARGTPTVECRFRHEKIREFFLVQAFLGSNNDRPTTYLRDARFRGVYFLLAMLLPLEAAEKLQWQLIRDAAETKDHIVSDKFIQLFESRKPQAA